MHVDTNASEEPAPFLFRVEVSRDKLWIGYMSKVAWYRPRTRRLTNQSHERGQICSGKQKQKKVLARTITKKSPLTGILKMNALFRASEKECQVNML